MNRTTVISAATFMLAALGSCLTIATPAAAYGMGDRISDRIGSREELRELLGDRIRGREDLRDLILDRLRERGDLRDLLADRLRERENLRRSLAVTDLTDARTGRFARPAVGPHGKARPSA